MPKKYIRYISILVLVTQGDIMYLQVVSNMMIVVFSLSCLRKGEELKAPRHASAAATRDGNLPRVTATCLYSQQLVY